MVKPRLAIENEAEREVQSKIDHIRQNRPESPIFDVEDPDESLDPPQKKQKLNRSSSSMLDFLNSSSLNDPSDDEEPQEGLFPFLITIYFNKNPQGSYC